MWKRLFLTAEQRVEVSSSGLDDEKRFHQAISKTLSSSVTHYGTARADPAFTNLMPFFYSIYGIQRKKVTKLPYN